MFLVQGFTCEPELMSKGSWGLETTRHRFGRLLLHESCVRRCGRTVYVLVSLLLCAIVLISLPTVNGCVGVFRVPILCCLIGAGFCAVSVLLTEYSLASSCGLAKNMLKL